MSSLKSKYHLKTFPLSARKNLVNISGFAKLPKPHCSFAEFVDSLPEFLGAAGFKELVERIILARRRKKQVVFAFGGHVIKTGNSPVVIDLIRRGFITAIVTHGAGAIHDYEISLIGETSEDVNDAIKDGSFGMAKETMDAFAKASRNGARGTGLGRALGEMILKDKNKFASHSILAAAVKHKIPAAVLVAIGTDITHVNPKLSGAELGKSYFIDFQKVVGVVKNLQQGVWLNVGSAVILPEVFLKAVSIARNLGVELSDFTTANLDMIQHYRPSANVTGRPSPRGISITGHHEIILPLLRAALLAPRSLCQTGP